jgi:26S proteasome regulatory subunit N2
MSGIALMTFYIIYQPVPTCSESLSEDEEFGQRQLAALLASKVFFYLGDLTSSLTSALAAGPLFDVCDDSDYTQTLLGD